jgi:hypothetical protein
MRRNACYYLRDRRLKGRFDMTTGFLFSWLDRRARAALFLPLALLLAAPSFCKDKKSAAPSPAAARLSSSGSIDIETSMAWRDIGTGGTTDWAAAPSSPSLSLQADGKVSLRPASAPRLRLGLRAMLDAEAGANAKSPSDKEPYLVVRDAEFLAAAGPYIGTKASLGAWDAEVELSALACARILDLTDADSTYQPPSSKGEDFWFSVLPSLGSTLDASLSLGKRFGVELGNVFLAWRGAEDAYAAPAAGFKEDAKAAVSCRILSSGDAYLDSALKLSAGWDSGIVLPSRKLKARIEADLGVDRDISLRLAPASIERTEDMPGFDQEKSKNASNRLGGAFEWRQDLSGGSRIKLGLSWPYLAWADDGESSPSLAEWEVSLALELR